MRIEEAGFDVNQVKLTCLSHIHGQQHVVNTLRLHLNAYFNIRANCGKATPTFGPVILTGPSGTGKTMVAKALHSELGNLRLIESNGVTVNKKSELYSILLNADVNTSVFIDEAQGMNPKSQYLLLTAISERKIYVPAGLYSTSSHIICLSGFTIILATTHEYLLQEALRNRIRIYCRFEYYSVEDLVKILQQRTSALGWQYESKEVLVMIAERAKGTPRLALNRNLQTCWHVTMSHGRDIITIADAAEAFEFLRIDSTGLDQLDLAYLNIINELGQAYLSVLSSKLSLPSLTLQRIVEPYL